VPANPLLAEPLYLAKYIERMGTGTGDMIRRCREAGLPEPEFALTDGFVTTIRRATTLAAGQVTGEVTGEVAKLLVVLHGTMGRDALQQALGLRSQVNFRKLYLVPALEAGYVEMTIPDKPQSRLQKYRLSETGAALLDRLRREGQET